jgi:hypothetical protein
MNCQVSYEFKGENRFSNYIQLQPLDNGQPCLEQKRTEKSIPLQIAFNGSSNYFQSGSEKFTFGRIQVNNPVSRMGKYKLCWKSDLAAPTIDETMQEENLRLFEHKHTNVFVPYSKNTGDTGGTFYHIGDITLLGPYDSDLYCALGEPCTMTNVSGVFLSQAHPNYASTISRPASV